MRILRQLAGRVRSRWREAPRSDRYRCIVVACLAPLAAYMAYAAGDRSEGLVPLATGLTAPQRLVVQDHLMAQEVPFELRDGGQTVLVPAGKRAELTVELTQLASRWQSAPVMKTISSGGIAATVQGTAISRVTSDLKVTAQEHGMTYRDAP